MSKLLDLIMTVFKPTDTEIAMTATIVPTTKGFGLFTRSGLVQDYTRERDAKRGAERRNLTLA